MISACAKAGQWRVALGALAAMMQSQLETDTITYNAVISACEKGGEWARALVLLGVMVPRMVFPDNISYNAAVSACGRFAHRQAISRDNTAPTTTPWPSSAPWRAAESR